LGAAAPLGSNFMLQSTLDSNVAKHTRVFLTGFMGSGKSAVGALAASLLDYEFVDLDVRIEIAAGLSMPDIFNRQGEGAFRQLETDALAQVEQERVVVALGGGAFSRAENREMIAKLGISVWLDPTLDELARRLALRAEGRPLLHAPDGSILAGAALRLRLKDLSEKRATVYAMADLRLKIQNGATKAENASALARLVREHLR